MQLRRLGLALERAQARARLALDVQRAIEVLLRSLELQLRTPAALAVLAQPGRLLDQQPPLARFGGHDRLDAPLGDDRVGLLAKPGVGEHLDHVAQPAARAVQAVAAVARALEPPHDRYFAQRNGERAVGVVEHDLDLGRAARLHASGAAEDHVLHRLSPHRQRRLLAHRPQHRVGDVRLARSVRPDDDAHTRPEVERGPPGKGLETLQGERFQTHRWTRFLRIPTAAARPRPAPPPALPASCFCRCLLPSARRRPAPRPRRCARAAARSRAGSRS